MTCQQCHRPAPTAFLCRVCSDRLRTWLTDLEGHADDLVNVIAKATSARGEQVNVSGGGESPLVLDLDAAEVAWVLRNTLTAIARDLCESRGIDYGGGPTSAGLAHWLAANVASIALNPDAQEAYDLVRYLAARGGSEDESPAGIVVRCVDIAPMRVYLGVCDATTDRGECGQGLSATTEQAEVTCPACGTGHDVVAFKLRVMHRMGEHLGTATEIAWYTRGAVNGSTIRSWAKRGRLVPVDRDGSGNAQYRFADVLDLVAQRRAEMDAAA